MQHPFLDDRDQVIEEEDRNEDNEAYQEEREKEQREMSLYPSEGIVY